MSTASIVSVSHLARRCEPHSFAPGSPGVCADGLCIVIAAAPVFGFPPEESVYLPFMQYLDMRTTTRFVHSPPAPVTRFNQRLVFLLQNEPIVVPARALPPGTQQERPPDWAYRREILEDRRDDLDRLAGLLPPSLRPVEDGIGVMAQSVADRVRWQAQQAPGRRWIPRSNVGVVTFHGTSDAPVARHSLYTFDLADPASPGRPYVVVDAPLTAGADEVAPAVPTAQESP
ncbi:MAG: hypothetical protein R3B06_11920 [Kofleriaceae bacterium]